MRTTSLEKYRRAAARLRQRGVIDVTRAQIAAELGMNYKAAESAVRASPWRKAYVGCVHEDVAIYRSYRRSLATMQERGEVITSEALARRRSADPVTVFGYLARHPELIAEFNIYSKVEGKKEELRRAVASIRAHNRMVTRKELAYQLNTTYKALTKYLSVHRELCTELDIQYLYKGFRK